MPGSGRTNLQELNPYLGLPKQVRTWADQSPKYLRWIAVLVMASDPPEMEILKISDDIGFEIKED